jgi:8-oxo-dGTP pyrophosphatase MutT (NUDIX family)
MNPTNNHSNTVQSVWWVVYIISDNQPKFLLIKRFSYGKKIERVAPKGKKELWETDELTCVREISEETWLNINKLSIKSKIWSIDLNDYGKMNKIITYYLVEYLWNPNDIKLQDEEWFVWVHKRAEITNALWLIPYSWLRDIFRQWYTTLLDILKKSQTVQSFEKIIR